jgi:hypothetical protein
VTILIVNLLVALIVLRSPFLQRLLGALVLLAVIALAAS